MAWNNTNILCCISLNQKFGMRFTGLNARCLQHCISLWNIDGRICSLPFPVSRYCSYSLDHSTSSSTFKPKCCISVSLLHEYLSNHSQEILHFKKLIWALIQAITSRSTYSKTFFMSVNLFPCSNVTVWMSKGGMKSVHYSLYTIMLRILGLLLKVSKIIEGVVAENG